MSQRKPQKVVVDEAKVAALQQYEDTDGHFSLVRWVQSYNYIFFWVVTHFLQEFPFS